jgi:hypothetical protein
MRCRTRFCTLAIWLALATAGAVTAQSYRPAGQPPPGRTEFIPVNSEGTDIPQRMVLETAKKANIERQVRMKAETAKLFKLAEELRDSVDKTNENILSLDVLKKADEIEKLAHRVKEKMKGPN